MNELLVLQRKNLLAQESVETQNLKLGSDMDHLQSCYAKLKVPVVHLPASAPGHRAWCHRWPWVGFRRDSKLCLKSAILLVVANSDSSHLHGSVTELFAVYAEGLDCLVWRLAEAVGSQEIQRSGKNQVLSPPPIFLNKADAS